MTISYLQLVNHFLSGIGIHDVYSASKQQVHLYIGIDNWIKEHQSDYNSVEQFAQDLHSLLQNETDMIKTQIKLEHSWTSRNLSSVGENVYAEGCHSRTQVKLENESLLPIPAGIKKELCEEEPAEPPVKKLKNSHQCDDSGSSNTKALKNDGICGNGRSDVDVTQKRTAYETNYFELEHSRSTTQVAHASCPTSERYVHVPQSCLCSADKPKPKETTKDSRIISSPSHHHQICHVSAPQFSLCTADKLKERPKGDIMSSHNHHQTCHIPVPESHLCSAYRIKPQERPKDVIISSTKPHHSQACHIPVPQSCLCTADKSNERPKGDIISSPLPHHRQTCHSVPQFFTADKPKERTKDDIISFPPLQHHQTPSKSPCTVGDVQVSTSSGCITIPITLGSIQLEAPQEMLQPLQQACIQPIVFNAHIKSSPPSAKTEERCSFGCNGNRPQALSIKVTEAKQSICHLENSSDLLGSKTPERQTNDGETMK